MSSSRRNRKVLENLNNASEERTDVLEKQLTEAKLIAEEADKKYDEVKHMVRDSPNAMQQICFMCSIDVIHLEIIVGGVNCILRKRNKIFNFSKPAVT